MSDVCRVFPFASTCEQLRNHLDWHVREGRGDYTPFLDQRGLGYLRPEHHGSISLAVPPDGETHDPKTMRVFVLGKY